MKKTWHLTQVDLVLSHITLMSLCASGGEWAWNACTASQADLKIFNRSDSGAGFPYPTVFSIKSCTVPSYD